MGDLGGSIITGIDGNPLAVLARQLGLPMHAINSEGVPLYTSQGIEANKRLDNQVNMHEACSGSCVGEATCRVVDIHRHAPSLAWAYPFNLTTSVILLLR